MPMTGPGFVAGGDIVMSRFVKLDTTTGRVVAAGAGDRPIGVSQKATHNMALSGGGLVTQDDGFAAKAGEMLQVYGMGERNVLLELGGTVANGDLLKASTAGVAIAATGDTNKVGARALSAGVSGQLIPVDLVAFDISA